MPAPASTASRLSTLQRQLRRHVTVVQGLPSSLVAVCPEAYRVRVCPETTSWPNLQLHRPWHRKLIRCAASSHQPIRFRWLQPSWNERLRTPTTFLKLACRARSLRFADARRPVVSLVTPAGGQRGPPDDRVTPPNWRCPRTVLRRHRGSWQSHRPACAGLRRTRPVRRLELLPGFRTGTHRPQLHDERRSPCRCRRTGARRDQVFGLGPGARLGRAGWSTRCPPATGPTASMRGPALPRRPGDRLCRPRRLDHRETLARHHHDRRSRRAVLTGHRLRSTDGGHGRAPQWRTSRPDRPGHRAREGPPHTREGADRTYRRVPLLAGGRGPPEPARRARLGGPGPDLAGTLGPSSSRGSDHLTVLLRLAPSRREKTLDTALAVPRRNPTPPPTAGSGSKRPSRTPPPRRRVGPVWQLGLDEGEARSHSCFVGVAVVRPRSAYRYAGVGLEARLRVKWGRSPGSCEVRFLADAQPTVQSRSRRAMPATPSLPAAASWTSSTAALRG